MLSTTFFTVKSLVYHDTYLPEDRVGVAIGVLPFEVCCTEDMFLCHLCLMAQNCAKMKTENFLFE